MVTVGVLFRMPTRVWVCNPGGRLLSILSLSREGGAGFWGFSAGAGIPPQLKRRLCSQPHRPGTRSPLPSSPSPSQPKQNTRLPPPATGAAGGRGPGAPRHRGTSGAPSGENRARAPPGPLPRRRGAPARLPGSLSVSHSERHRRQLSERAGERAEAAPAPLSPLARGRPGHRERRRGRSRSPVPSLRGGLLS